MSCIGCWKSLRGYVNTWNSFTALRERSLKFVKRKGEMRGGAAAPHSSPLMYTHPARCTTRFKYRFSRWPQTDAYYSDILTLMLLATVARKYSFWLVVIQLTPQKGVLIRSIDRYRRLRTWIYTYQLINAPGKLSSLQSGMKRIAGKPDDFPKEDIRLLKSGLGLQLHDIFAFLLYIYQWFLRNVLHIDWL